MARMVDAAVIGAGPGGYVAAIRLAQLGKKVVLVERDRLGGECLNYGCIPSKALITVGKLVGKLRRAQEFGLRVSDLAVDVAQLQKWKRGVVEKLTSGVAQLCRGNGIDVVAGNARFESPHELRVTADTGDEAIQAASVIVATGSAPIELPGLPFDGQYVIGSKQALELPEVPRELLVVGGGVIGLEIGLMYARLGSRLTIIELTDQLLPGTDRDLVRVVERTVEALGATVHLQAKALRAEHQEAGLHVTAETPQGPLGMPANRVLVAVGRRPVTAGLGLEEVGVKTDARGFIETDAALRTSVPNIYAIGDVRGPPFLAHKASKEGIVAAEAIAGLPSELDYQALPDAIFTEPEIATVGLSETKARAAGREIAVGRFPFSASGRALTAGETDGFVKVIAEKGSGRVLGVAIVGPEASDLISEAALAIEMGATAEDIALTVHPHPTLPESLVEAAEAALGRAIHQLRL